jgi:hypothetical protein
MAKAIKLDFTKKEEPIEAPTSVKDFINDPKCIAVALESAQTIKSTCGDKWFDIFDIMAKFGIGLSDALQKLDALKLFGFIHERLKANKDKEYKVCLSDKQRLVLTQQDIKFYEEKLAILKKTEKKLQDKIAKVN